MNAEGPPLTTEEMALTCSERSGLVDVMTDHERSVAVALIAGYEPKVFDHRADQPGPGTAGDLAAEAEEPGGTGPGEGFLP